MRRNTILMVGSIVMILGVGTASGQTPAGQNEDEEVALTPRPWLSQPGNANVEPMDLQPRPDSVPGEEPGTRPLSKSDSAGRPSDIGGPVGVAGPHQIVRPDEGWAGKSDPDGKGKGGKGVDDSGLPKGGKKGGGKTTPRPQGADAGPPTEGDILGAHRGWAGVIQLDETPPPDSVPGEEPGPAPPIRPSPAIRPN